MEPVVTPEEMGRADAETIRSGTPGITLMDRAAYACAVASLRLLGGGYGRRVLVVAGKGNNGGDGVAAARHLASAGARVDVLLLGEPTGDAAWHLARTRCAVSAGRVHVEAWSPAAFERAARRSDLVIDAVFGTGFSGEPAGTPAEAVSALQTCRPPVLAVDIPSGVSGADGAVRGAAVRADVTVAIQALKVGHVAGPGATRCGRVEVADIGIHVPEGRAWLADAADARAVLPPVAVDAHKYERGSVVLVAGSVGMTGAAVLAGLGALTSGAGLVVLGAPRSALTVMEGAIVEAVKVPLSDGDGRLEATAVDELEGRLERAGAVGVGPGIGRSPGTVALIRRLLETGQPLVVDADGLWALAEVLSEDPSRLSKRRGTTVLTPHGGELGRLLGRGPSGAPIEEVRAAAERWGAVVHLKGHRALTAAPDGRVWVNATGGPAMATGGTGDVLTGVVAGLCAQGLDPAEAMWAGAALHGAAGDIAAARSGRAMRAGDLVAAMPHALRRSDPVRWTGTIRTVLEGPEAL